MTDEPSTPELTPGQRRTLAATRGKKLWAQRRKADALEALGWVCTPPAGIPRHADKD